jgi:hypothetical protein
MEKPTTQSVAVRAAGTTEQAAASGAFLNDRPGESPRILSFVKVPN